MEADEQLLLEAATRQLLVKTLRAGKDLTLFYKVWKLAMAP
jgi:hypothetical protein